MFGRMKFWSLALGVAFLLATVAPAFAGDRDVGARDLKGISPHRHRYIFSVIGGAAVGAGIGKVLGGGNDISKGLLIGSGGMSALYLHSHRSTGGAYRDWLFIGSHTALGTGIGWTVCGCNSGALAGGLIGGGASAIWRAMAPDRGVRTASAPTTTSNATPPPDATLDTNAASDTDTTSDDNAAASANKRALRKTAMDSSSK